MILPPLVRFARVWSNGSTRLGLERPVFEQLAFGKPVPLNRRENKEYTTFSSSVKHFCNVYKIVRENFI